MFWLLMTAMIYFHATIILIHNKTHDFDSWVSSLCRNLENIQISSSCSMLSQQRMTRTSTSSSSPWVRLSTAAASQTQPLGVIFVITLVVNAHDTIDIYWCQYITGVLQRLIYMLWLRRGICWKTSTSVIFSTNSWRQLNSSTQGMLFIGIRRYISVMVCILHSSFLLNTK